MIFFNDFPNIIHSDRNISYSVAKNGNETNKKCFSIPNIFQDIEGGAGHTLFHWI
jgi:hypothetical protein